MSWVQVQIHVWRKLCNFCKWLLLLAEWLQQMINYCYPSKRPISISLSLGFRIKWKVHILHLVFTVELGLSSSGSPTHPPGNQNIVQGLSQLPPFLSRSSLFTPESGCSWLQQRINWCYPIQIQSLSLSLIWKVHILHLVTPKEPEYSTRIIPISPFLSLLIPLHHRFIYNCSVFNLRTKPDQIEDSGEENIHSFILVTCFKCWLNGCCIKTPQWMLTQSRSFLFTK